MRFVKIVQRQGGFIVFYEQLKKACEMNSTTVTAIAKFFGLSTGNVTRWKNGGYPSVDILLKLKEHLNVSTDFLLTGKDFDHQSSNESLPDTGFGLRVVKNEMRNCEMDNLNWEIVEKGLKTFFWHEKAGQYVTGGLTGRKYRVLDENGRVQDKFQARSEISMKRLKSFVDLKDCPTREEFNKMLDSVLVISPDLKAELNQHPHCVALLAHLYDCEHFAADEAEDTNKRLARIEAILATKFTEEFRKEPLAK